MRTSNMTEGGPKTSTQKRIKNRAHIAPLPVGAGAVAVAGFPSCSCPLLACAY